jgi:hypothetical protein
MCKKMKGKKRNLRTDTAAVSGIIGAVLLVAIAVTMLTIFQASMVPYWNKQVEAAEIKVTYDDMMFLPSDIEDVAIHETPKTCTIQLGAQYPDRMIFRNPGPGAAGTLTVEEAPAPITVIYNDGTTYTVPYNSKRITYELKGTINSPKLVYEHGVIITDWGTAGYVTTDEQKLIANDDIYIPIVNGSSSSQSGIGVESLAIKPYEYLDTLGDINTVNVSLNTSYPELWEDTLLSPSVLADLDFSGTVSFGTDKIYINTSVPYLKLPNQTASGPLYAGMISCTVEDPDGGGGGGNGGSGGSSADDAEEDTSATSVAEGQGSGQTDNLLQNIKITNIGDSTIVIELMRVVWSPDDGEKLNEIRINTVDVTNFGQDQAVNGAWLPLSDVTASGSKHYPPVRVIEPGEEITIDVEFDKHDMGDKTFNVDLLFEDGSIKSIELTCVSGTCS